MSVLARACMGRAPRLFYGTAMTISPNVIFLILGAVALLVAIATGALRRGRLDSPDRLAGESPRPLAAITLAALAMWILVPSLFLSPVESDAATAPAQLSATQKVVMGLASAGAGAVVLIAGNLILRPGGLTRLGFGLDCLPRGAGFGVVAAILATPITLASVVGTEWLWNKLHIEHPSAHELLTVLRDSETPALRAMVYLSAIVLAPLYEELFFRGHLQTLAVQGLRQLAGGRDRASLRWGAIVVTSILFAIVHTPWMIPPIFVLSLALGYVYERTGNLWAAIVLHTLFNALNVTLFTWFAAR